MSPKTTVALLIALALAGVFALAYTNNWLGLGEQPQPPKVAEQTTPTPEPRRPAASQPTSKPAAAPAVPDVVDKHLLGEGKDPLATADFVRMELDRPGKGRVVATREPRPAARWELVEPAQPKPDTAQLDDLVRAATEFKIAAAFPPGDPGTPSDELAGLASPVAVLTLTEQLPAPATTQPGTGPEAALAKPNERQFRIAVGGPDVLRPGRTYVRVTGGAGSPAAGIIYAVDDDVRKKLDVDLAKLRGKGLWELTSAQIQRVEVKSAGGDQQAKGAFTLERTPAGGDAWAVSFVNDRGKAIRGAADSGKASSLAGVLASMEVTAWGDHKPAATDLRLWGLAPEPKLTVKMVARKDPAATQPAPVQETVIKFGLDREGGGKYACIDGKPDEYFIVANTVLSSIDLDREELRDKRLLPAAAMADVAASDLVGVTVTVGGANPPAARTATLIKDAKQAWRMVAPVQCLADSEAADKLIGKLTGVKVAGFEDEPTAVTTASLANPRLTITLDRGAGKPVLVVLIGGTSATGKSTIVKAGDIVARVETADLDGIVPDAIDRFAPLSLADKAVWTLSEEAIRQVKRVDAKAGASGNRTIVRLPDGGSWQLTEPVKMDADADATKALLSKFASLKARQRTAMTAAQAGLDRPAVTLEFTAVEKAATTQPTTQPKEITARRTLALASRDGVAYCQADGNGPVFQVEPALLTDASVELASRKLLAKLEPADKATRLTIESKGSAGKVELVKGADWRLRADAAVNIDAKKVEEVVNAVGGLSVVRYVDFNCRKPADYGLDKPATRVSITWPGAGEAAESVVVTLLVSAKGDADGSFAMIENDGKVGLLSPADLAKIQKDWKAFEQGKEPSTPPGPGPMGGPMGMPPGMRGMPPE